VVVARVDGGRGCVCRTMWRSGRVACEWLAVRTLEGIVDDSRADGQAPTGDETRGGEEAADYGREGAAVRRKARKPDSSEAFAEGLEHEKRLSVWSVRPGNQLAGWWRVDPSSGLGDSASVRTVRGMLPSGPVVAERFRK